MTKEDRFELIRSRLAQRGNIDGDELARELAISKATIRRDLDALQDAGFLRRTHGGARLLEEEKELAFHAKLAVNLPEKRAIAALVASLVNDGRVIACTGGTTVMHCMKALRGKRITVVTNAINIAMELAAEDAMEVIVTGGTLRTRSYELVGHISERTIRDFHVDIALLGVDGISFERGLSTFTIVEAHTAALYMEHAEEVWVVADHGKVGRTAPALIAPLDRRMRIITDSTLDPALAKRLAERIGRLDLAEPR